MKLWQISSFFFFIFYLEDNEITELEGKSEETFSEGLAELAEDQEVTESEGETEMWSKYIAWCEERFKDKDISETLREKVSGQRISSLLFLIPLSGLPSQVIHVVITMDYTVDVPLCNTCYLTNNITICGSEQISALHTQPVIPYSKKFSNGTNFHVIRKRATCAKIIFS